MPRIRSTLLLALATLMLGAAPAAAVVGGEVATRDFPHMAAMEFQQDDGDWTFVCGASLVRADVVLTAAHCVQDDPDTVSREDEARRYRFLLGTRDRLRGGERIEATRVVDHPQYDPRSGAYDVALLKLARATTLGAPIRIAEAREADRFAPGVEATIVGWGATVSGGPPVTDLREGQVPIVSDAECARGYTVTAEFDPPTMICAGNLTGGEDSCQGDSGGPLMVPDASGRFVLVGDVSFGFGCAFPTQYGVYGEVAGSALRPFVDAQIAELSPGTPGPAPGGGPTPGPAPGTAPAAVQLPRRLGSAARARRAGRIRLLVRTSRPLRGIRVTLRRGRVVVASGRRARALSARGRVSLRVRRGLRAGGAVLTLTARDSEGRRVRAVRRVRLRR
jgi:secreted trypsin-like serine protease